MLCCHGCCRVTMQASPAGSGQGEGGAAEGGEPQPQSPSVSLAADSSMATTLGPSPVPSPSPASTAQVGDLLGELLLLDGPAPTPGAGVPQAAPGAPPADAGPLALAVLDGSSAAASSKEATGPAVQVRLCLQGPCSRTIRVPGNHVSTLELQDLCVQR